jgi:hypothetical protein
LRFKGRKLRERRVRIGLALAAFRTRAPFLTGPVCFAESLLTIRTALVTARTPAAILAWRTRPLRTMVLTPFLRWRDARCSLFADGRAVGRCGRLVRGRPLSAAMLAAMRLAVWTFIAALKTAGPPDFDQHRLCRCNVCSLGRGRLHHISLHCDLAGDLAGNFAVRRRAGRRLGGNRLLFRRG